MSVLYKNITGRDSPYDKTQGFQMISVGYVTSVDDPLNLSRIRVKLIGSITAGGDKNIDDDDLTWCNPLLPKMLSITPKVGEAVLVFVFNQAKTHTDRLFIGPIISQPNMLAKDEYIGTALAGFSFGSTQTDEDIRKRPELVGVFPNVSDISIQGRNNTEVTQKDDEIWIRAGKFVKADNNPESPLGIKLNTTSQAYLQIKNNIKISEGIQGSATNIVASKINLLTHNGSPSFKLNDREKLISDDEFEKILSQAHQLPFGDILLQYLRLLKDALFNHVHNGNGNAATDLTTSGNKQSIAIFKSKAADLENRMLSNNIRIN
jgi:hypothetical protein